MASCGGNCGGCSGCARELTLSEGEIDFLRRLGEVAFLPVARQLGELTPIYPETDAAENMSLILELLEKKGLISLDYDQPLTGFAGYGGVEREALKVSAHGRIDLADGGRIARIHIVIPETIESYGCQHLSRQLTLVQS